MATDYPSNALGDSTQPSPAGTPSGQLEAAFGSSSSSLQENERKRMLEERDRIVFELVRLSTERDALARRVETLSDQIRHLQAHSRREGWELSVLRRLLAEAAELTPGTVTQASPASVRAGLLQRIGMALGAYRRRLDDDLAIWRSQRAWRVMLLVRMAYTLLLRRGWSGRFQFAKYLFGARGVPGIRLEDYDLSFPEPLDFIPAELHPLLGMPARGAAQGDASAATAAICGGDVYPKPGNKCDVLILPVFEFDFRMQRPQQVAAGMAAQGHRVFWVSPRGKGASEDEDFRMAPLRENLWEVQLPVGPADLYLGRLGDGDVDACMRGLGQLYRKCCIGASCVLVQLPFWRRIALRLREHYGTKVVFDCMDDWESMPALGDFTRGEDSRLARECDLLIVTSGELFRRYRQRGASPHLVRNGVEFNLFSAPGGGELLGAIPRPVVGYFGAIAQWFDYSFLFEVAKSRPDYSFVLLGGFGLESRVSGEAIQRLQTLKNVHLLGHKPYSEMPLYLAEFDACIIPFVLNDVTKATDPVKLYEYLSQGKPVVATAMGELAEVADLIYVASDAREFAEKLDEALQEDDDALKQRRIQFARASDWRHRVQEIEQQVNRLFPMVSIIFVTRNAAGYIGPCLDSLQRNTDYPCWEAVIVDNCSSDGTVEEVEKFVRSDARFRLVRQERNTGFAGGSNIGVRNARGEHLILLNPDTLVTPGWMGRLLRHVHGDGSAGMIIPVTNWAGNEVKIEADYGNLEEMEEFALEQARKNMGIGLEISVGPLFCALIPRKVWEEVGELDERFEVGMFEDDDYSLRMKRAGYRILCAEDCFVHHFGQGAFSKLADEEYQAVFERNRRRYEEKWGFSWVPHRYRPGVSGEGRRFVPAEFA